MIDDENFNTYKRTGRLELGKCLFVNYLLYLSLSLSLCLSVSLLLLFLSVTKLIIFRHRFTTSVKKFKKKNRLSLIKFPIKR